jgi:cytochrome c biogenesis protein CcdA
MSACTDAFKEGDMAVVGLAVTFAGFLISASSVGFMSGNGGRLVMVLAGIVISLFGIMGLLNPAYQKDAIWKR